MKPYVDKNLHMLDHIYTILNFSGKEKLWPVKQFI